MRLPFIYIRHKTENTFTQEKIPTKKCEDEQNGLRPSDFDDEFFLMFQKSYVPTTLVVDMMVHTTKKSHLLSCVLLSERP